MYRRYQGIPPRHQAAYLWLRNGAEEGDAVAQYLLAEAYLNGKYESQNLVQAYMWLILSARQGFPVAVEDQEILAKRLSSGQIVEAQRLAKDWRPKK